MAWEGYRLRLCKCNGFNENGLFGRDIQTGSAEPILQGNSANRHHQFLTVLIAQKSDARVDSVTYSYGM